MDGKSYSTNDLAYKPPQYLRNGNCFPVVGGRHVVIPTTKLESQETYISEVKMMKQRFAKLLLGEDMSGGANGVSTALAISNAITNLSASVFGELWKLEALSPQRKLMWRREMDWLLCVSDSIVELKPSLQELQGGGTCEVMVPRPRSDLYVNLPALKKLDAMLLSVLDGFRDSEFYYADRGVVISDTDGIEAFPSSPMPGRSARQEEKWWLPFPKVPSSGLSEDSRKKLQECRECTNQILKAAMAINSNVLAEMEIPNAYLNSLPKYGKDCLGEAMYRYLTADQFSPECLLDYLDQSSEYTTLEIANRVEASVHIWKQKHLKRHSLHATVGKSSWGDKVKGFVGDIEKAKVLARRAESFLQNLRLRFPGLSQTSLDVSKIQHNKVLHPAAEYHASARAISGGPLYDSDAPRKQNFELFKKLVLPVGSILRARLPGRPTRDCLFTYPARDGLILLKIWNMNKYTGVLDVYNCQGAAWNNATRKNTFHQTKTDSLSGHVKERDVHFISEASWTLNGLVTVQFTYECRSLDAQDGSPFQNPRCRLLHKQ